MPPHPTTTRRCARLAPLQVSALPQPHEVACFRLTATSGVLAARHTQLAAQRETFGAFHGSRIANW